MALTKKALRKLTLLKQLDNTIDFSRSAIQLEIVMALTAAGHPLTATALSEKLGERRKAILDALRKLENKGIVEKRLGPREIEYTLSKGGREYALKLLAVLGDEGSRGEEDQGASHATIARKELVAGSLLESRYLYKAILYLAHAPGHTLSLKTLARLMNLSPERAKSYLDLFSLPPNRIFRRITHPRRGIHYRLEEEGLKLYHRMPEHLRGKKNPLYRLMLSLEARLSTRTARALLASLTLVAQAAFTILATGSPTLALATSLALAPGLILLAQAT